MNGTLPGKWAWNNNRKKRRQSRRPRRLTKAIERHDKKPGKPQKQKKAPPVLISEGPEKRVAPCNRKNSKVRT
jgi:hypothetical protein